MKQSNSIKTIKVSACLITWKGRKHIGKIVDHLYKYDFINEILIRNQSRTENLMGYGRYRIGEKAENEWLYVQDDDCINKDLQKLYDVFIKEHKGIVHAGTEESINDLRRNMTYNDQQQACMVGFGAFIKKSWIKKFSKYKTKYGVDYVLRRESDRILSILVGGHHTPVLCDIKELEGCKSEKYALSKQTDHINMKEESIKRARAL